MKRLFILLFISGLVYSCMKYQKSGELLLVDIPWGDKEKVSYCIYNKGKKIGESKIEISKQKGMYVLDKEVLTKNKIVNTKITLDAKDLMPIYLKKNINVNNKNYKLGIQYDYKYSFIRIKLIKNNKRILTSIPLSKNVYDNESLLYLMRAYPPDSPKKNFVLLSCMPEVAQIQPINIKILNDTNVINTNIGKFNCYKVVFKLGKIKKHYAFYQYEKPHHLIKYSGNEFEYVISSIEK